MEIFYRSFNGGDADGCETHGEISDSPLQSRVDPIESGSEACGLGLHEVGEVRHAG